MTVRHHPALGLGQERHRNLVRVRVAALVLTHRGPGNGRHRLVVELVVVELGQIAHDGIRSNATTRSVQTPSRFQCNTVKAS